MSGEAKTVADVLEAAAAEIERSGLHKGWFWRETRDRGPCCAKGAVHRACDDTSVRSRALEAFDDFCAVRYSLPRNKSAAYWNDLPSTTQADVCQALRAAAARERAR